MGEQGRRLVEVGSFFLKDMMRGEHHYSVAVETELPDDAHVVWAGMNQHGNVELVFESMEWPALEVGEKIPPLQPVFHRLPEMP